MYQQGTPAIGPQATTMANPTNPYVGAIPDGFKPGTMIRIQACVPTNACRFSINLQYGANQTSSDIGLHIECRFKECLLIRNHLQSCLWGPMETLSLPVKPGCPFEAIFLCQPECIKMAFNGQQCPDFGHRMPFSCMTHLNIEGDIQICSICYKSRPNPIVPPVSPRPSQPQLLVPVSSKSALCQTTMPAVQSVATMTRRRAPQPQAPSYSFQQAPPVSGYSPNTQQTAIYTPPTYQQPTPAYQPQTFQQTSNCQQPPTPVYQPPPCPPPPCPPPPCPPPPCPPAPIYQPQQCQQAPVYQPQQAPPSACFKPPCPAQPQCPVIPKCTFPTPPGFEYGTQIDRIPSTTQTIMDPRSGCCLPNTWGTFDGTDNSIGLGRTLIDTPSRDSLLRFGSDDWGSSISICRRSETSLCRNGKKKNKSRFCCRR